MEKTHLIYQIIRVSLKMTKNRWRKSSYLPFLMKLDRNSWIFSSYFVCEHFFLVLFYSFDTLLLLRLWSTSTHQLLFNSPTNFLLLLSYFFSHSTLLHLCFKFLFSHFFRFNKQAYRCKTLHLYACLESLSKRSSRFPTL